MTDPRSIRIVIVDDHHMFRTGVRSELTALAGPSGPTGPSGLRLEIVGEAGAVESATQVITQQQPDVVLLDVHLPGGDGHGGADVIRACAGIESQAAAPAANAHRDRPVVAAREEARAQHLVDGLDHVEFLV